MFSKRAEIENVLKEVRSIFESEQPEKMDNLYLIITTKTQDTLLDLNFDVRDVIKELTSLELCNYSETLLDKDNNNPPKLYVFGKEIKGKEVYIKFKIREMESKKVICVSFHYSEHKMKYRYC